MRKLIKTVSVLLSVLLIWQGFGAISELKASAVDTGGLSVSLGAATNSSGTYYYNNATVTGSGIKTILLSFSESVISGDKIILPTSTPDGFVVSTTSANNDYTKRINIDNGADASAVQSYLREISFTLASTHTSQSVKVTITTQSIQYDTFYDVDTQHYYQFIPYTSTSTGTAWTDAYTSAERMEYMSRTGYLATITSLGEDTFINSLSGNKVGWLGGTALINNGEDGTMYYQSFKGDTSSTAGGNNWYWACGPERGEIFYKGRTSNRTNCGGDGSGNANNPYWNWANEPSGGGETCLTTLFLGGSAHGTAFSWNDITYNYFYYGGTYSPGGFFVEYGNLALGSSETVDITKYAGDSGSLSATYSASISGSPVAGHTLTANLTGGSGTLSYQWTRDDGDVTGATSQAYTLTAADVGHQIAVKVTLNGTTVISPTVTVTTLTLDSTLSTMPDISEDISTDSNTGKLVSDLLNGHASGVNGDTLGIAVTATDNTNGEWQYMMPGGQWWSISKNGTPSETNALLIPSDAKIRFCPAINYNGTATITYRAWDEVLGGSSEASVDVSVNGAGTAFSADESGAEINVTAVNDPPQVIKTGGKKALEFGGATGDYMQVPDMQLDGSFTCEAYVYIKNATNYSRIFDFGSGAANTSTGEENGKAQNNEWFGFSGTSGKMEFQIITPSSSDNIVTDQALPTNQWVQIAVVFDKTASMGYIYWNGVLEQKGTIRQTDNAVARINSYIGRSNWFADSYLQGNISNISFWNTAKSQSQIQQDMGMKITGNETGLVAAYDMTSGSGTTVSDLSPNKKTAQLYSLNWVDNDVFDYNVSSYENSDIAVSNLRMTDVDAGSGTVQIQLAASQGTLTFGSTTGLTFISCSNGQSTLTVQGTMQDINSALSTLTYHPNTDFTGTDHITVQADDLGCTGAGGPQTSDVKTVNVTMQPVTVPDAPSITSVTSGGSYDKAAVTFTPPLNNGGGGITGYTITATPDGGGTAVIANGDGIPITVSNLQPGITYDFTVAAINSAGTGAASALVKYTTPGIPTAPTINATVSGSPYSGSWTSGSVTMVASGSTAVADTIDHYEYKIGDTGTWTPLDTRNTLTENANINDTVYFRAVGGSGLAGTDTTPCTVKIDKTAPTSPTITITTNPVKQILHAISFGLFFNDTVNVALSSMDNLSGVKNYEYQLVSDGGTLADNGWTTCGSTFSINPQFKGIIYARAADNAGNFSAASQSDKFVTDRQTPTAPTITETVGGNAYDGSSWTAGNVKLAASGSTALSGIDHYEYSMDNGGTWTEMEGQSLATDSTSGQYINDIHTVSINMNGSVLVRAASNSGIKGEAASVPVKRDAAIPTFNVDVAGTVGQWTGDPVTFTLSNTANNISPVAYWMKTGSGDWTQLSGDTYKVTGNVDTTYQFKAISGSGLASSASDTYTVKLASNTLDDVINKIDNLPDPGSASDKDITDHAQAIKDVKILYDTLNAEEQSGVGQSRIDKLNKLIGRLNTLLVIIPKDSDTGITAGNIGISVKVPELNDSDVSKVVVKLMVNPITSSGAQSNTIAVASESLDQSGRNLIAAYDVSLFKTVFDSAGNQTSYGKVSNSSITGPITIRIPVPEKYQGRTDLQVVYIDDSGKVMPLATTLVTVDGVQYLQFTTTHFSVYAITTPETTSSVSNPKTGDDSGNLPADTTLLFELAFLSESTGIFLCRKRNRERETSR